MEVRDFTAAHAERAAQIAKQNYDEERAHVPALPAVSEMPDLAEFAENGLGVAAFEDEEMVGFLCVVGPFQNAFRSTRATGVFSPMNANGTARNNRAEIYARMYQAAGEKWANAGATSHAVCFYAHDIDGQEQFFRYGFGLRCIDAIRDMADIETARCEGIHFVELQRDEFLEVLPLDHLLDAHMAASPTFMLRPSDTEASFMANAVAENARFFAAKTRGQLVAFLKIQREGETFICDFPVYIHVNGAFCMPEYRGMGIYKNLLALAIRTLRKEGYTRLGVDFESINPTAHRFWRKYFSEYTRSVVRRIDENGTM